MPKVRIVKKYVRTSEKAGIEEVDFIDFNTPDEAARFVTAVNADPDRVGFEVIDYDVALKTAGKKEIISNPTGGYVGKIV